MYFPTPDLVRSAWDHGTVLNTESGRPGSSGINLSSVINTLIHTVGRFNERYAGDMLYELKDMIALTNIHELEPEEDSIIIFGIRRDGVDGVGFLMARLREQCLDGFSRYLHVQNTYRKILAVRVVTHADNENLDNPETADVSVELRDLTDAFSVMTQKDADWDYARSLSARADFLRTWVKDHENDIPEETRARILAQAKDYDRKS